MQGRHSIRRYGLSGQAVALATLLAGAVGAQVRLQEVAELARQRAERARPEQTKALEPFWADLGLEYGLNQAILDQRIAAVAALGDSVVPVLLERLAPARGGSTARNIADNCRRVLERLDPPAFVDALIELANGNNEIGREQGIRLLGRAPGTDAGRVLCDLLDRLPADEQRLALRSLRMLRDPDAAPKVANMLLASDRRLREDALHYLIAVRAGAVADTAVQALSAETDNKLLPLYIEYFAGAVTHHAGAATALLPLLDRERLDWRDTRALVKALATIAPPEHEPTCRRLLELADGSDTSSLAVQAAVSLRQLGDKQGVTKLKRALDEQLRRSQRKREATLYEQRANLLLAIEDFAEASNDYEKMLEFSEGIAMTRRAYIGLVRCEAHRKRVPQLLKHLKASGMTVAEIESLGQEDPAVRDILASDRVQAFLDALAKDQAPR